MVAAHQHGAFGLAGVGEVHHPDRVGAVIHIVAQHDQLVKTPLLSVLPHRLDGLSVGVEVGQKGNFHGELADKAPTV